MAGWHHWIGICTEVKVKVEMLASQRDAENRAYGFDV